MPRGMVQQWGVVHAGCTRYQRTGRAPGHIGPHVFADTEMGHGSDERLCWRFGEAVWWGRRTCRVTGTRWSVG